MHESERQIAKRSTSSRRPHHVDQVHFGVGSPRLIFYVHHNMTNYSFRNSEPLLPAARLFVHTTNYNYNTSYKAYIVQCFSLQNSKSRSAAAAAAAALFTVIIYTRSTVFPLLKHAQTCPASTTCRCIISVASDSRRNILTSTSHYTHAGV